MTEQFEEHEKIYRAVYPPEIMPMFWKENGEISSAVFKDKNGLSVEHAGNRPEDIVIRDMYSFFCGSVISLLVNDCTSCKAIIKYLPTKRSKYHSEIHGAEDKIILSQSQCKYLAKRAVVCV